MGEGDFVHLVISLEVGGGGGGIMSRGYFVRGGGGRGDYVHEVWGEFCPTPFLHTKWPPKSAAKKNKRPMGLYVLLDIPGCKFCKEILGINSFDDAWAPASCC